jgi:alkylation response protein AidB-like acyl-CoA dehydrogenase
VPNTPSIQLELSDDQQLLYDTTVGFVEKELPLERTRDLHDDPRGYDPGWLRKSAELGWFALLVPEEHGGGSVSGHPVVDAAVVAEVLGRHVQPGPFIPMNVVAAAIAQLGTAEQREATLPAIVAGELVATWAPYAGNGAWDLGAGLTVTRDAGELVLDGVRGFVQDAQTATQLLVAGSLDGEPVQLLVPTSTPGVEVQPLTSLDLARRFADVRFSGVRLPAGALVGAPGAEPELDRQLHLAVALSCAETVGALDAMVTMTVAYAKDRIAFGRPIGSFQAIKHVLADVTLYLEACKAAAVDVARAVDAAGDDVAAVVAMAASYIGEHATDIAQECLQVHGGIGYTWEHDLHLYLRRTQSNSALYGEPTWHRERLCAAFALGEAAQS